MMKIIIAILFTAALLCCKDKFRNWKQENNDYIKDSICYEDNNIYIYPQGKFMVVAWQRNEYYPEYIKKEFPGVTYFSVNKAWIDSSSFDLEKTKEYFSEFTHQRMR